MVAGRGNRVALRSEGNEGDHANMAPFAALRVTTFPLRRQPLQVHHSASRSAQSYIYVAISIEITCGGRGEERHLDLERRVAHQTGGRAGPLVAEQHQAVTLRADQQIEVSVTIQIGQRRCAAPADPDLLELVADQLEPGHARITGVPVVVEPS